LVSRVYRRGLNLVYLENCNPPVKLPKFRVSDVVTGVLLVLTGPRYF